MKHILCFLLLTVSILQAQVGIGTTSPAATSILDLTSTSKGLLAPRMTASQKDAISSPATGLLIYQTDGTAGFYYYTGSAWVMVSSELLSKTEGTNFTGSRLVGHATTGTLNAAEYNTGCGLGALQALTTGDANTAFGYNALITNTYASDNTAFGFKALFNNGGSTLGYGNTATGSLALFTNTSGGYNVANGVNTLYSNTTGQFNVAIGTDVLKANTSGTFNTGVGYEALMTNSTANANTAVGARALKAATGSNNVAVGYETLKSCTSGYENTGCGTEALEFNTIGYRNVAFGIGSLYANTEGYQNTAIGSGALPVLTTGDDNTAIGDGAALTLTTGNNNIYIGRYAVNTSSGVNNEVVIGNASNNSYKMYTSSWTNACDSKLKHSIKAIPIGLDFIKKLRPVEFVYNNAANGEKSLGFIAQEVQKVVADMNLEKSVDLVTPLSNEYLGLKTTELIAVLTKAIQEQQAMIENQQKEINELKKILVGKNYSTNMIKIVKEN